jgi:hypothetical protein
MTPGGYPVATKMTSWLHWEGVEFLGSQKVSSWEEVVSLIGLISRSVVSSFKLKFCFAPSFCPLKAESIFCHVHLPHHQGSTSETRYSASPKTRRSLRIWNRQRQFIYDWVDRAGAPLYAMLNGQARRRQVKRESSEV